MMGCVSRMSLVSSLGPCPVARSSKPRKEKVSLKPSRMSTDCDLNTSSHKETNAQFGPDVTPFRQAHVSRTIDEPRWIVLSVTFSAHKDASNQH